MLSYKHCNFEILIRYSCVNLKEAVGNMTQIFRVEVKPAEKIELR